MLKAQQAPDVEALVRKSIARWRNDPTRLLQVLREIQESLNHVPPQALSLVARLLRLPLSRVKGVAGFYTFLSTEPWGRYRVLFSDNVTDRMQGSERLLAEMCHRLWVEPGKVSEDGLVSVATTSCTGLCDQGPGMLVNGRAIGRLDSGRVEQVCGLILRGVPLDAWPAGLFAIDDNVRRADALLGHGLAPGDAIRAALRRGVQGHSEHAANERSWREGYVGAAAGSRGRARGSEALEPARPRRRGIHHRHQVGGLPARHGQRALRDLQRRRGRARDVQGPRAAREPCRPRLRWHDGRRLRGGRGAGLRVPARRVPLPARAPERGARGGGATRTCSGPPSAASRASTSTSRSTWARARTSAARSRR